MAGFMPASGKPTPGKWRIEYDEWEFCHILSGVSVIEEEGGEARTVRGGRQLHHPAGLSRQLGGCRDDAEGICDPRLAFSVALLRRTRYSRSLLRRSKSFIHYIHLIHRLAPNCRRPVFAP